MLCHEKGVIPPSEYFFFHPSESFQTHYHCVLNCGHFYCQEGYSIRREGNTVPLLLYIIEGTFHLEYEGREYTATNKDILLIDGQKPHYYYSGANCEFLYVHYAGSISNKLTNHLISQNGGPLFHAENHAQIYKLVNDPIAKLYYGQSITDVELSCMIYTCLCKLQESLSGSHFYAETDNFEIAESIHYIRNHLEQELNLELLASQANLSTYYYAHLFKKEMGISPMEYISRCRIGLAKTMLKTTQQSIGEIAETLGYSSSSSFINAFSSRVGTSPLKFRNSKLF